MSIHDSLNAYTTLRALVPALVSDEEERGAILRELDEIVPLMVQGLRAEVRRIIEGPPARAAQQQVRPAAAAPAAPAEALQSDYTYDDWALFAEREGRNPADFIRTWFRDIEGGFDASTAAQRVDQWAKAKRWIAEQKAKATQERPTVINGGQGEKRKGKTGNCPDCGKARQVTTKYGQRWRCDEHDYWGNVG